MVGDFLECLPELPNHVGDWLARWHGKNIRRQATWHQSTTSHPPLISNFPLLLKKTPNGSVLFCSILDHGLRGRQCCHFFPYLMFEFSIPWGGVWVLSDRKGLDEYLPLALLSSGDFLWLRTLGEFYDAGCAQEEVRMPGRILPSLPLTFKGSPGDPGDWSLL